MSVRWLGVIIGFIVNFFVSQIILSFSSPSFSDAPDLTQTGDLLTLILLLLSTGLGGYIAGRMAERSRALNGLLVGAVGVLFNQIGILAGWPPQPRIFAVAGAVACLFGALGGFLARFPAQHGARPSGPRK